MAAAPHSASQAKEKAPEAAPQRGASRRLEPSCKGAAQTRSGKVDPEPGNVTRGPGNVARVCEVSALVTLGGFQTSYCKEWARRQPARKRGSPGFFSRLQTPVPTVRAFSAFQPSHQVAGPVWSLGRLNHVAVAVPDLAKAQAFYKNVLGAQVSEAVPLPEHGVSVVFVNLGNTKIELLHPLGNDSPIAGFLQKNKAGGMHHVCIEVDNINAAVMDLKEKKIRSLSDEAKIGAHGKPVIFLHPKDCGGVLVELEQA
ncbi:PREDICTED: methylmalonyl-CoA epimerase, mitochondrial [Hipposideros armiger]|uniref:Methylmalonyl-CoA epimerase, mitochondrial n=1 Tax=Hipposideros armiger TaxID=186990 RepID=A0A8B7PW55_HIPAR|nr:PREDICTED: methylmalonyl-CoA epimerase, mitochondrial [Hipposideros armiger]